VRTLITVAVVRLLNTISKSSVCNNATWKRSVCDWIRTTVALLHNHRMRNARMSTLLAWRLVLMEFSSGGRAVIGYSLMLLLFKPPDRRSKFFLFRLIRSEGFWMTFRFAQTFLIVASLTLYCRAMLCLLRGFVWFNLEITSNLSNAFKRLALPDIICE